MHVKLMNLQLAPGDKPRVEAHGSSRWLEIGPVALFAPANLTEADEFAAALVAAANELRSSVTKEMYP